MTIQDIGSRWYKFDFHTHTPASSDHKAPDETETDWLKALMLAEVDCVALTDHVSGGWINRIKSTYDELDTSEEWYRPLNIFPGSEITVTTGQSRVHVLALFDPSCDEATITGVLGRCGILKDHGDAEITCATESVDNVIDIVQKADGIAIPAHIDGPKGLLHNIQHWNQELESWLNKIEAAECINLQFRDGVNHQLQKTCEHLALVQGSDAHKASDLGWRTTWIKMSKPSIEGLKLALHDHVFCVDNGEENPNNLPDLYLSELHIEKMSHCGRIPGHPANFKFHPLFNAVIGGRGSGKSTIIESIRLALGKEKELEGLDKLNTDLEEFTQGVTTDETKINVDLIRRDDLFRGAWRKNEPAYIDKYTENNWIRDHGKVSDRFPVSIYSQKQINALSDNPNSLWEIIDKSKGVDYLGWDEIFKAEHHTYLTLNSEIRKLQLELECKDDLQGKIDDLDSDITSFEQGGHKDVFDANQLIAEQTRQIKSASNIDDLKDSLSLIEQFELPDRVLVSEEETDSSKEINSIHSDFFEVITDIIKDASKLSERLDSAIKARRDSYLQSTWWNAAQKTKDDYSDVVKEYEERGAALNPDDYERWLKDKTDYQTQLEGLDEVQKKLDEKKKQRGKSLDRLYVGRLYLQKKRSRFIRDVLTGNSYVRMTLHPFSNKNETINEFRSIIGVVDSFTSSIYSPDSPKSILFGLLNSDKNIEVKNREIQKIKAWLLGLDENTPTETDDFKVNQRFLNTLVKIKNERPETFDRLTSWWPQDELLVEYAQDPGANNYKNISKGSAGQKAAAILAFLLSHGDNPIIVDQPEDDLDNALIYKLIVSEIQSNKKRRQIIMVTHNPNIVVNGDAEYVNVLHFKNGQVQLLEAGGLGEEKIREHVCDIMEGGAIAFEKRYNRLKVL